jgi:hypothetical protein
VAWNDLARHPFPAPARLGEAVSRGTGSQATVGLATKHRVKRVRTQASATMVLVEPKHPSSQTGSGMERFFFVSSATTDRAKSRELISSLKVYGTLSSGIARELTPGRVAAWEPIRSVHYVAPPVKLIEEVSAAARELVEQLNPAKTQAEATRPRGAVDVEARTSTESPEEFLVSSKATDFVLRGIHATSEIAVRQFATDNRWAALADLLPSPDLRARHEINAQFGR